MPYLTARYYLLAEVVWFQAMKVDEVQSFASLLVSLDFLLLIEKQNKSKLHPCAHQWKASKKSDYPINGKSNGTGSPGKNITPCTSTNK